MAGVVESVLGIFPGSDNIQCKNRYIFFWTAVYSVALKQPRGSSLVVTHCTAYVRLTLDITVMLGLVPVELSTSISGSHAATYVVNTYLSQICVYLY